MTKLNRVQSASVWFSPEIDTILPSKLCSFTVKLKWFQQSKRAPIARAEKNWNFLLFPTHFNDIKIMCGDYEAAVWGKERLRQLFNVIYDFICGTDTLEQKDERSAHRLSHKFVLKTIISQPARSQVNLITSEEWGWRAAASQSRRGTDLIILISLNCPLASRILRRALFTSRREIEVLSIRVRCLTFPFAFTAIDSLKTFGLIFKLNTQINVLILIYSNAIVVVLGGECFQLVVRRGNLLEVPLRNVCAASDSKRGRKNSLCFINNPIKCRCFSAESDASLWELLVTL